MEPWGKPWVKPQMDSNGTKEIKKDLCSAIVQKR